MVDETGGLPPLRVVGALAVDEDRGRFLMTRRLLDDPSWPGCWEFPGGKVEDGEDDQAALRRELREEIGVEVEVGEEFTVVAGRTARGRPLDLHVYLCRLAPAETPRCAEVAEIRWVTIEEARGLPVPPADGPVLEEIGRRGLGAGRG